MDSEEIERKGDAATAWFQQRAHYRRVLAAAVLRVNSFHTFRPEDFDQERLSAGLVLEKLAWLRYDQWTWRRSPPGPPAWQGLTESDAAASYFGLTLVAASRLFGFSEENVWEKPRHQVTTADVVEVLTNYNIVPLFVDDAEVDRICGITPLGRLQRAAHSSAAIPLAAEG